MSKLLYRLPKAFAEEWIAALRSGEYKQGQGSLVTEQEKGNICYCCLGVIGKIKACEMRTNLDCFLKDTDGFSEVKALENLPSELINSPDKFATNDLQHRLATLNDEGKSFKEIADWMEENIEFYE